MSEETYKMWGISPGLSRNMFFEKEERMEKCFLWKEKDITKGIAIENVKHAKRKVSGRKIWDSGLGWSKAHWGLLKEFAIWKWHDEIAF